jgi:hypothetical protein
MPHWTLTRTRLVAGTWEALLTGGPGDPPVVIARHRDLTLDGIEVSRTDDGWALRLALPGWLIGDGTRAVLFVDRDSGEVLDSLVIAAGDGVTGDVHAELALLRDELDLLKRAFRRHCRDLAAGS